MDLTRWIERIARLVFRRESAQMRTHVTCQVVSYTPATNLCSVQPCVMVIRTEDPDNLEPVQLPQIDDVPVRQFGSGKCLLSVAPQAGSYGVLHVSDRAIENWMLTGGIVAPSSARRFDIGDGFFEPGAYPVMVDGDNGLIVPPINTDRIEMRDRLHLGYVAVIDDGNVEIDGVATVKVGGAAASEPAMQGTKFITKYNAHTHSTAFGPSGVPVVLWLPADNSTKVMIG